MGKESHSHKVGSLVALPLSTGRPGLPLRSTVSMHGPNLAIHPGTGTLSRRTSKKYAH
jgi:hypothetical protein